MDKDMEIIGMIMFILIILSFVVAVIGTGTVLIMEFIELLN